MTSRKLQERIEDVCVRKQTLLNKKHRNKDEEGDKEKEETEKEGRGDKEGRQRQR